MKVLKKIERKGQLISRKNQWLTNVRDTGLFEIRSNVGRNQQRGLGYYDNERKLYIILTAFTKKDIKFNGDEIKYAHQLKEEAMQNPNFVSYQVPIKPESNHQSSKKNKQSTTKSEPMEEIKMPNTTKPVNLEHHLESIIPYQSIEQLAKSIDVKPIDINHFIFSPQIENVRKTCDIMQISVDDLFQYTPRHSSYPINPAWRVVKKYQKTEDAYILMRLSQNKIEVPKIDKQTPISTIFKLADKYQLTLNQLFDYQGNAAVKNDSNPVVVNDEQDNESNDEQAYKSLKPKYHESANKPYRKIENKNYDSLLTTQLMQNIILKSYDRLSDYNQDENIDMTMNDIYDIKDNQGYAKIIEIAKVLQVSCQKLLSYHIPTNLYNFEQSSPVQRQSLMDYFYHKTSNPIMDYLHQNGYRSYISKNQFLKFYGLTVNNVKNLYHTPEFINLLTFAQNFHVPADKLINKSLIENNMYSIIQSSASYKDNQKPDREASIQPTHAESNEANEINESNEGNEINEINKDDNTMTKTNSVPANQDRLERMFEEIKQLSHNQVLILNDLINSWK